MSKTPFDIIGEFDEGMHFGDILGVLFLGAWYESLLWYFCNIVQVFQILQLTLNKRTCTCAVMVMTVI